jgi:hypothetical protein
MESGKLSRYSNGLEGRGSIPGRGKISSLLHNVQISSGARPASQPMEGGKVKRPGRDADHSPRSVEVNSYTSHPHTSSWNSA